MATTITAPSVLVVPVGYATSLTIKSNYKSISYSKEGSASYFSFVQTSKKSTSSSCQVNLEVTGIKAGNQKIKITSNGKTVYCEVRVIASISYQTIKNGVMSAPYINQGAGLWNGSKWTNTSWPKSKFAGMNRTLAQSGCGQCCIAMALSYCLGTLIAPIEYQSDSHYRYAHGSDNDCGIYVSKKYNVEASYISKSNWNEVIKQLKAGNPVMAHMYSKNIPSIPNGQWTTGRHYILLVGVTSDGKVAVHDPNHTNKTYPIKKITFTRSQIEPAVKYDFTVFKKKTYTKKAAAAQPSSSTSTKPASSTPASLSTACKNNIKAFQRFLNTNYLSVLKTVGLGELLIDGDFGAKTRLAAVSVWKYMANKYYNAGLTIGNANFFESCRKVSEKMTVEEIKKHPTLVYIVQGMLAGKGLYSAALDGDYGTQTIAAVKAFQKQKSLTQDGKMNASTWYALFN